MHRKAMAAVPVWLQLPTRPCEFDLAVYTFGGKVICGTQEVALCEDLLGCA